MNIKIEEVVRNIQGIEFVDENDIERIMKLCDRHQFKYLPKYTIMIDSKVKRVVIKFSSNNMNSEAQKLLDNLEEAVRNAKNDSSVDCPIEGLLTTIKKSEQDFSDGNWIKMKFYRTSGWDNMKYWQKVDINDFPYDVTKSIVSQIQQGSNKILVLQTKDDDEYIDIASEEKFYACGLFLLKKRVKDDWYGCQRIFWNGEAQSQSDIAKDIISMAKDNYEKASKLAWWFHNYLKDHEYMGYSFCNLQQLDVK